MKYCDYVNIKQGTDSIPIYSGGNTLPLTQLPFAMASFCPETVIRAHRKWEYHKNWFYNPHHKSSGGIRLARQPSPWIGDYGALVFLPQVDTPKHLPDERLSVFRENALTPYYMNLHYFRAHADFELSPTFRGAYMRVNFTTDSLKWFSIFNVSGDFCCEIDYAKNEVSGYTTGHSGDNEDNFKQYFVLKFPENGIDQETTEIGDGYAHIGIKSHSFELQFAISYISHSQTLLNLEQDTVEGGLDAAKAQAIELWEKRLSTIEIEADEEDKKTFYSCMYRCFLFPHAAYEINENGDPWHLVALTGKVAEGTRYTDTGFWDTSRTLFPLLSIIAPDDFKAMMTAFVNEYRDSGWLPRWLSFGERGCMPSTLFDSVLADAAVKGLISEADLKDAFRGMVKHSNQDSHFWQYGRSGAGAYCKYGYVPTELEKETVNLTTDAAYGDWCIAEIAAILGETETQGKYRIRAKNYKNLFDSETGFMRGRDTKGNFRDVEFDPTAWYRDYTEGSAWQNSFFAPHDMNGLAQLYGGKEKLSKKMDQLFEAEPVFRMGDRSEEVHEMTELTSLSYGQCAINNQPSFHIPYIYAELGETEKSRYWVQRMCREVFSSADDGFPGDEDNGSMAAWYIFGALGFYPFCPGCGEYLNLGETIFKSVRICGKTWEPQNLPDRIKHNVFK